MMNLDNISEQDLDRLLEDLDMWALRYKLEFGLPVGGRLYGYSEGRQIIREWLESLGDKS